MYPEKGFCVGRIQANFFEPPSIANEYSIYLFGIIIKELPISFSTVIIVQDCNF